MTDEPTTIDSTADELPPEEHEAGAPSTAVARRERRSEVIRPLDADQLVESFASYQALLPRLLTDADYQQADGKRFVKKSGWRKIATAFDLDVQLIRSEVERDDDGRPVRAEVWARAIAPSGRMMDGDGYCSVDESRFSSARGRQKLENDLRATATTRAMNRAISGLVGMGEVSAEEVDAGGAPASAPPAWTRPAPDTDKRAMLEALEAIIGDRDVAVAYARALANATGGEVPAVVAQWAASLPKWIEAGAERAAAASPSAGGDEHAVAVAALDDDALARVASASEGADPARVVAAREELDRRLNAAATDPEDS